MVHRNRRDRLYHRTKGTRVRYPIHSKNNCIQVVSSDAKEPKGCSQTTLIHFNPSYFSVKILTWLTVLLNKTYFVTLIFDDTHFLSMLFVNGPHRKKLLSRFPRLSTDILQT